MSGVMARAAPGDHPPGPGDAEPGRSLVVVSHRGPVRHRDAGVHDGSIDAERSGGGLATALRDLARHVDGMHWICAAATDADHEVARARGTIALELDGASCTLHMLDLPEHAHDAFYARIANPLLWFVQHSLWDHALAPDIGPEDHAAWDEGYLAVNRAFADAIADVGEVPLGSLVMVHDYHFYAVPAMVRAERPDLFLHFFVHIPWPHPDAWRTLPGRWRDEIFAGLLGADIVAFHTQRYARNFLLGCEEQGYTVDRSAGCVLVDDRPVAVRHYPISIDERTLRDLAASPEVAHHVASIESERAGQLVVRVDRTDPSKNIVRGFRAFDRMLELHPELAGSVRFLALLQPSRQDVREYADYLRAIHAVVDEVNGRHAHGGWTPIELHLGDDMALAAAAYRAFDVLMVNAVADGMNLVAKEALLLNERAGVLALSEHAGAHEELGAIAVTLEPFDIEQQAAALYAALTMPAAERRLRHEAGLEIVRTNDVGKWLHHQFGDVAAARAGLTARATGELVLPGA